MMKNTQYSKSESSPAMIDLSFTQTAQQDKDCECQDIPLLLFEGNGPMMFEYYHKQPFPPKRHVSDVFLK